MIEISRIIRIRITVRREIKRHLNIHGLGPADSGISICAFCALNSSSNRIATYGQVSINVC